MGVSKKAWILAAIKAIPHDLPGIVNGLCPCNVQPEDGSIRVFKSVIVESL